MNGRFSARLALLLALLAGCDAEPFPDGSSAAATAPAESSPIAEAITRPADGAQVHLIRLVQRGDTYAFDPAEIEVEQGDVVRFIATGSQPESISFERVAGAQGDFVDASSLQRGVLLTQPGDAYDVRFADAPPGQYPFLSVPHAERGMRGVVTVLAEE